MSYIHWSFTLYYTSKLYRMVLSLANLKVVKMKVSKLTFLWTFFGGGICSAIISYHFIFIFTFDWNITEGVELYFLFISKIIKNPVNMIPVSYFFETKIFDFSISIPIVKRLTILPSFYMCLIEWFRNEATWRRGKISIIANDHLYRYFNYCL